MEGQKLSAEDELTRLVRNQGIETWEESIEYVKALPYGRNSNRTDFKLAILEQRGTCSSKHAMLKKLADSNQIAHVKLILGMYRMNKENTPNIGNVLHDHSIEFIPEAHCYLKINGNAIDITSPESSFKKLKKDILEELEIQPEQVSAFKVEYHKAYIQRWLKSTNYSLRFDEIWSIREKCIENLTREEMELNSKVKESIDKSVLCWLATSSAENIPNVSPKEIFHYYGTDKIIIANIASPQTVKNIQQNENVCISFIDILVQKGFQIKGKAKIVERNSDEFLAMEKVLLEMTGGKFPFSTITAITIEQIKPIIAPRYILYPETTEQEQIESAKKQYGI